MSSAPPLPALGAWQPTRDTLHAYARILGKLRAQCMPPAKHWWHITLTATASGLTTGPFPVGPSSLELELDLNRHELRATSSAGWSQATSLASTTTEGLVAWLVATLAGEGLELDTAAVEALRSDAARPYEADAAAAYRAALLWVDARLKTLQGEMRAETSPVHLFPHHFDLAMNWFSGRLVPGVDPADEEKADEQLNFGFVTGDSAIHDAYFYATAYPAPEGWTDLELPAGAYWHTEGWTGAVMPYAALANAPDGAAQLLAFLRGVQAHGATLMGP